MKQKRAIDETTDGPTQGGRERGKESGIYPGNAAYSGTGRGRGAAASERGLCDQETGNRTKKREEPNQRDANVASWIVGYDG